MLRSIMLIISMVASSIALANPCEDAHSGKLQIDLQSVPGSEANPLMIQWSSSFPVPTAMEFGSSGTFRIVTACDGGASIGLYRNEETDREFWIIFVR